MDKIAIISDIHGNITALNAVLKDIENKNINKIYCLGDLVVKCANPDLVIDKLKEKCEVILKGNCDESVCNNKNFTWTRRKIGKERIEFLNNLPVIHEFYMSGHLIRLFHASPLSLEHVYNPMFSNESTHYSELEITNPEDLFLNTEFINKSKNDPIPDIIGYGHIHTPNLFRYKNKTIFNTGSVGVPIEMSNVDVNDPNNKFSTMASYIVLEGNLDSKELENINFTINRVLYNIEIEVNDILKTNMATAKTVITNLRTGAHHQKNI